MVRRNKRGAETRELLVQTATGLFSERGFDGASTRDIAEAAGTTLASIQHLFGSKQGLYQAVLEDIAASFERRLRPASAQALTSLVSGESRDAQVEILINLLSEFSRTLLSCPPQWTRLLLHEQLHHLEVANPINRMMRHHIFEPMWAVVASIRQLPEMSKAVHLEVFMLLGSITVFRTSRLSPLKVLRVKRLTPNDIEEIVALQRAHVMAIYVGQKSS